MLISCSAEEIAIRRHFHIFQRLWLLLCTKQEKKIWRKIAFYQQARQVRDK